LAALSTLRNANRDGDNRKVVVKPSVAEFSYGGDQSLQQPKWVRIVESIHEVDKPVFSEELVRRIAAFYTLRTDPSGQWSVTGRSPRINRLRGR